MTGGSRRARALRHGASVGGAIVAGAVALAVGVSVSCYSTGDGSPPPAQDLYFPVGLAVSAKGNVLYVANSDFDLQYNGGTVQSYDLAAIRLDVLGMLTGWKAPLDKLADDVSVTAPCDPAQYPPPQQAPPGGARLGWLCAPPVKNQFYWRDAVTTGAFATTMELAKVTKNRLFLPVRGDASLTWIDVAPDTGDAAALAGPLNSNNPFFLDCERDSAGRCSATHSAGNNASEPYNTRGITMPGEPFGMAQSDDGVAIAITHQTDTKTSLLLSGLSPDGKSVHVVPSLQFVLDGLPSGGVGLAAIPHDPAAVPVTPFPAFLQSSRAAAEIDLLRFHPDVGISYADPDGGFTPDGGYYPDAEAVYSSNYRPYLVRERTYGITANSSGVDSRSIAIDPTPRLKCEADLEAKGVATTDPSYVACAQLPARVFIANRAPASLLLGQIGQSGDGGKYDPDSFSIYANVPLSDGPSNVFLAPIVDKAGNYALRVFITCFDSQRLFIYDPDAQRVENILKVGTAPYAMAFDPFDWKDVAAGRPVANDPRGDAFLSGSVYGNAHLKNYRFAYLANFTTSYIQILDLDASFTLLDSTGAPNGDSSFETIAYTLGEPKQPKGQ